MRTLFAVLLFLAIALAQGIKSPPWRPGPMWGGRRGMPEASNMVFATADGCALCHSTSQTATAMWSPTGEDESPYGLWQASMMANAFRDPYWRAQVAKEMEGEPDRKDEIQALCLTCHAPMLHHTQRLSGAPAVPVREAAKDALAVDGVSCTACHQAGPESGFSGQLDIGTDRVIYGPFPNPIGRPMEMHSRFTPIQGHHMRESELCGACHTLFTKPSKDAKPFPEQAPYLEWKNSRQERTCQDCHMPPLRRTRIARNPAGRDFLIDPRPDPRGHIFVGGNTFMLRLLRENAEALGVTAPKDALSQMEQASRNLLGTQTAEISIGALRREGGRLHFDVAVRNLTGHKLPTGYPARRVWLSVQVRSGRDVLFQSGAFSREGRITGVADASTLPHYDVVESKEQVVVYEARAVDAEGKPTTYLSRMAGYEKDNRLLPSGWRHDGEYAEEIRPRGIGDDADFVGGWDTVHYRIRLPEDTDPGLRVVVWLLYQSVPPTWVDPLRSVDAEEARTFVRMYDKARRTPETLAVASRFE